MIKIGCYRFAPRLIPTLVTMLLLPILIALGCWQLQRADQKQQLQHTYEVQQKAAPVNLDVFRITGLSYASLQFHAAKVTGYFDNQHQFLLDNKFYQHQVGYQVITPFILVTSGQTLLINRGWIPAGNNRQQLPAITPVSGTVTLLGMLTLPEKNSFMLSGPADATNWPQRIQSVDLTQINKQISRDLLPVIMQLDANQPYGFQRDWVVVAVDPAKNYGYAFQWFALALTLLIIYFAVNIHKQG